MGCGAERLQRGRRRVFRPLVGCAVLGLSGRLSFDEMQPISPNTNKVNGVLKRLESETSPSDVELSQVLAERQLFTGLDHWSLWTLVCLVRHRDRQKWVGYIVESRLKGDLRQIGCAGAFGHPEALPQLGDVPGEPEWKYYFHGCGCCLTNKVTGDRIDVDFTREGGSHKIDRFFYSSFLLSLAKPKFPERQIRREEPLQHSWQVEIDRLSAAACIKTEHGLQCTTDGVKVAEAIEPLSNQIAQLLEWGTPSALRKAVYVALAIGDVMLASQLALQTDIGAELRDEIAHESDTVRQARLQFLKTAIGEKDSYGPSYLAAIADLGPELAEACVLAHLLQTPVDGTANTALEIMRAWNQPNVVDVLKSLLDRRYAEATGFRSVLSRLTIGKRNQTDQQPRNYQVTQASLALLQRVRADSLDPQFKSKVRFLVENAGGAQAGEAALLVYVLDRQSGLQALRRALSGKVPAAHKDAAAACVIIGSNETEQILKEALSNSDAQIQHTAACTLAAFSSEGARDLARSWFARNDGIKDPLGQEVTVLGRTTPVFTFEDISHANMDEFFKWSLEKLRKDFKSVL